MTMSRRILALSLVLLLAGSVPARAEKKQRGASFLPNGGTARVALRGKTLSVSNRTISAMWSVAESQFKYIYLLEKRTNRKLAPPEEVFTLVLADGRVIKASELKAIGPAHAENLVANPNAARFAEQAAGKQAVVALEDPTSGLTVTWRAVLRDASNYLRQEMTLRAGAADIAIKEIVLLDAKIPGAKVVGTVQGSPVVAANWYLGIEHPMSQCKVNQERAVCSLGRDVPLRAGQSFTVSAVIGIAPEGQLRRGFLDYVERERAHAYRTFLHYNSWYDLGYFQKFDEAGSLEVIEHYGRELVSKRGVKMDSFLFDDGWDDPKSLWNFHSGFPNGFTPLKEATAKYGAAPGVWMSPWGGYGNPRKERLEYGAAQGFETNQQGFALSGPVYYKRFREVCMEMIRKYGVNQFKFDGVGRARGTVPGSEFGSDFEAAIHLISELRAEKPDLYVNLTTGTWPSPFWLRYADSIWRGGSDHDFTGVGTNRQRWMTYRDAQTYKNIVQGGPLFPLSSLMLHGLIYARHAKNLDTDPQGDFSAEVRSYFGSGTQLQEMYVTPSKLTPENWDALGKAAAWSRGNADVLKDTHWVGGDPGKLQVYGWASWSPRMSILVLRNPADKPATFDVDAQQVFELPKGAPQTYQARSPWKEHEKKPGVELRAGQPHTFTLAPFEVLTLELTPARGGTRGKKPATN
jgi:hypothetical protein